ncbi:phage tail protein, partial [Streptomyces sp. NPDC059096]
MRLPAVFADDDLAQRFVGGLDEVLAPFHNVLDCLDTYFVPSLAPADFARWLGSWVGAETGSYDAALASGDLPDPETTAALRAAVGAGRRVLRVSGTRRGGGGAIRQVLG